MSQSVPNPFQAPIKKSVESQTQATQEEVLDFIAIAKKWERYRLIYNGILILETGRSDRPEPAFGRNPTFDRIIHRRLYGSIDRQLFLFTRPGYRRLLPMDFWLAQQNIRANHSRARHVIFDDFSGRYCHHYRCKYCRGYLSWIDIGMTNPGAQRDALSSL